MLQIANFEVTKRSSTGRNVRIFIVLGIKIGIGK